MNLEEEKEHYREMWHSQVEENKRLIAEVERLRNDLKCVTNGLWTQTELDAAKWRAHEMMLLLKGVE